MPGVIALHSVSGEAEEEGDGDHHEVSNHHEMHAIRHQELHDLLLCRGRLGNSFPGG